MTVHISIEQVHHGDVAARKGKGRRGGARPGAGRKPVLREPAALTVALEGKEYEEVFRMAEERGVSLASVIREAVRAYVSRGRRR